MANLTVENLNRITQGGDVDAFFGTSVNSKSSSNSAAGELRAATEMQAQGMQVPQTAGGDVNFLDVLKHSVDKVNQDQVQADTAIKELVAGRSKNIHETMLAIERADLSLKLMLEVRNKILDAYKEVMRMQV